MLQGFLCGDEGEMAVFVHCGFNLRKRIAL